jgi:(E)-4-hydroxy-3-methyl-but-2-enyl pyrophosphate reductase
VSLEIRIAPNSGFCFGVRRAIDLAEQTLRSGGKVYSLGPIIHNPQVIDRLRSEGLETIENVEDVSGGKVIIRSHGVHPDVIERLREKRAEVIDATCPLVKKAQAAAALLHREDYTVLIVGERDHPEVQGLLGHAPGAVIVGPKGDLPKMKKHAKLGLVAQTTQYPEDYKKVIEKVAASEFSELRVFNTICNATIIRQEAAVELAKEVDIMFVLGGRNSANTNRLAEICKSVGVETHHLETADELDESWLAGKRIVGITAGASTPEWLIEEFISHLERVSGK